MLTGTATVSHPDEPSTLTVTVEIEPGRRPAAAGHVAQISCVAPGIPPAAEAGALSALKSACCHAGLAYPFVARVTGFAGVAGPARLGDGAAIAAMFAAWRAVGFDWSRESVDQHHEWQLTRRCSGPGDAVT